MCASSKGLDPIFEPRSIAVIGASSDPNKTGGRPIHMLKLHGFAGAIYPVNPTADTIQGLTAYPALEALPEVPDLILVLVPGAAAVSVLEVAAQRGVGAAIVLSAGFAESGPEGAVLQQRLTELVATSGMRILGPNCLGAVSVRNCAIGTFSISMEKDMPATGGISIVSQSGNVGSAALSLLGEADMGIARFIATGNEADVQASDALAWLAHDPETKVILLSLETCRDADRLIAGLNAAREAGKPVIVLKIGTSEAGQKAALSHTGGLAGSDRVFDAAFRRYGAVRVYSLEDLVQVGAAVEAKGARKIGTPPSAAMVAASGGFGVMMADAAASKGVAVNSLSETTQALIKQKLPLASAVNPIDATAQMSATPEILEHLIEAALSDPANGTVCIMLALGMKSARLRETFTDALRRITERYPDRTLVACISGPRAAIADLRAMGVVCFPTIDATMSGIAALSSLEQTTTCEPDEVIPSAPLPPHSWRNEVTAKAALRAAGIPFTQDIVVASEDDAAKAAEQMSGAVAMKILSPDIQHKSDIGGVELDVQGPPAARAAFKRIIRAAERHAPGAQIDGIVVAPMTAGGTELILGTSCDPTFGPVVMVGLGGIFAEIFEDTSLELAPVRKPQAEAMLRNLKTFALLDGARGQPVADIDALSDAIVALSRFAVRHAKEVSEIDINPLLARAAGEGCVALDALIVPHSNPDNEVLQ
jgi:acyl-CoA synthetase (NDP forming)